MVDQRSVWFSCSAPRPALLLAIVVLLGTPPADAITVNVDYDDTQPGAVMPAFDPNGTQLLQIANYVGDYYGGIFDDNHTIDITFWYTNLPDNQLGNHDHIDNNGSRETEGTVRIDTQNTSGVTRNYWYDPTPADDSEFTMVQTFWRDLTPGAGGQQGDWYVWSGTVPDTFEAGYRSTGGTPTGGTDMLSLVMHEVGHALGMSGGTPSTITETMDGNYDYDTDWVFGASLAADTVDQATDFIGHLDNSLALMFPSGVSRRERPSHTDLFAMASGHNYTSLDVPRREFYNPNGDWNTDGNWSGDNTPESSDDAFVRSDRTAILSGFGAAGNLSVLEGALVSTQTSTLFVQNTTNVGDGGGLTSQITINTGGQLDSDILNINDDGRVVLVAATSELQSERVNIAVGGELRGTGTVDLNDNLFGLLTSEGTIRVTSGELLITSMNGLGLDLQDGEIEAIDGDLRFDTGMISGMGATLTVGAGRQVAFDFGGSVGAGGLLQLSGTSANPATSVGSNLFLGLNGGVNATGRGDVDNTLILQPNSFVTTEFGDPNSEIRLNGSTLFQGGRLQGHGTARQNGDAFVNADTLIDIETYDMDGVAGSTTITIDQDRTLDIQSPQIDTTASQQFDGTIDNNGGTLTMMPDWRMDGTLNLTETGGSTAVLNGAGTTTITSNGQLNVSGSGRLESDVVVEGGVFVGSEADFNAQTSFTSTAMVDVDSPGDFVDLNGPATLAGGSYVGGGAIKFDNEVFVIANTSIGTADTDLDGDSGNAEINIDPNVTFSVASSTLELGANDGFDGIMNIQGTFSSIVTFRLDGELNMTAVDGANTPTLAGVFGFNLHSTGAVNTTGDALINRDTTVSGTMNIGQGTTQINGTASFDPSAVVSISTGGALELNGTSTFNGGSYAGDGLLRFNATAEVNSSTSINTARIDLDGSAENTTVNVNDVPFSLNVDSVDATNNLFGGTVNVTGENARLAVNLTNPLTAWRLASGGILNFTNPAIDGGPATMLTGSGLSAEGIINGSGRVTLAVDMAIQNRLNSVTSSSDVHFAGGGRSTVHQNVTATIAGAGAITIDNGTTVNLENQSLVAVDTENVGRLEVGFAASEVAVDFTVPATATIRGAYAQSTSGEFAVDLGGLVQVTEFDLLDIIGVARLNGTVEARLIDGFVPQVGNQFQVLTATTVINEFDQVVTIDEAGLFDLDITALYSPTDVVLRIDSVNPFCDFNDDSMCNLTDINLMFQQGDLVVGVGIAPLTQQFDLVDDDTIDNSDVTEWLSQAGAVNGYGSPYRRGDADEVGALFPSQRDVDITDFNTLANNFTPAGDGDPTNGPFWDQANFDGDDDVDITDFNFLSSNFAPGGYGASQGVPEPSALLLFLGALVSALSFAGRGWRAGRGKIRCE